MKKTFSIIVAVLLLLSGSAPVIAADTAAAAESRLIKAKDLKVLVDKGETVLIVDVRSPEEFDEMHITGAISVPLHQVETKLGPLSHDTKIVFY